MSSVIVAKDAVTATVGKSSTVVDIQLVNDGGAGPRRFRFVASVACWVLQSSEKEKAKVRPRVDGAVYVPAGGELMLCGGEHKFLAVISDGGEGFCNVVLAR
jgi:hypothetical protein